MDVVTAHDANGNGSKKAWLTIIALVAAGGGGGGIGTWVSSGGVVSQIRDDNIRLGVKFENMDAAVRVLGADLKEQARQFTETVSTATRSRYTADDAAKDRAAMVELITSNQSRIDKLSDQLHGIELWKARIEGGKPQ